MGGSTTWPPVLTPLRKFLVAPEQWEAQLRRMCTPHAVVECCKHICVRAELQRPSSKNKMTDTRIVNLMAFSSVLAPMSITRRLWRKIANTQIDNGATKVICLQSTNVKSADLNKKKCLSKGIWDIRKLKIFLNGMDVSNSASSWTVSVKYLGNFIIAVTDFKQLNVAIDELNVEMITSSHDKIMLAVRCVATSPGECLFLKRNEAGERLKVITNEILCCDYENFLGYILYKKLDLNLEVAELNERDCFDWCVEIFLSSKGANDFTELLIKHIKELESEHVEVCCGIFRDADVFPEHVKQDESVASVNG